MAADDDTPWMFLPLRLDAVRLRVPAVTLALLAASVALFVYECTLGPVALLRLVRAAGAAPWELAHGRDLVDAIQPPDLVPPPFTIATSWFLHGDVPHLLGNAWFLWRFGSVLEGRLGPGRFLHRRLRRRLPPGPGPLAAGRRARLQCGR